MEQPWTWRLYPSILFFHFSALLKYICVYLSLIFMEECEQIHSGIKLSIYSCRNKGKTIWQNRTEICASVDSLLEKLITTTSSCSCVPWVCSRLLLLVLFPHQQLLFGLEECSFFSALINMLYPVIAGITITLVFTLCNRYCLPSGLTFLSFYCPFQQTLLVIFSIPLLFLNFLCSW